MVFRNIILVPFMWVKLCYYASHVDKYSEEKRFEMLKFITTRANKGGNVTIEVHGRENIPEKDGFMFFPNHQGLYDVVAHIQFLKQVFACMKAYMIDRDNVRQAMQVIIDVADEVKNGRNYLIFAEGTRSRNGNEVQPFKGGSFKAATKARCPIVPVALVNSFVPFDSSTIKPVTVQVHFLKPLYYDEYKDMKTTEIAEQVKDAIQQTIMQYDSK